jgi:hypothetical protein
LTNSPNGVILSGSHYTWETRPAGTHFRPDSARLPDRTQVPTLILKQLWQRGQKQGGLSQETLVRYFEEAGLPLSATVVKRMLREERRPREDTLQVVSILLRFFAAQRVLLTEDEVEAVGAWFGLAQGAALGLVPQVACTNLDVPLNGPTFQKPEEAYRCILDHLTLKRTPYVALEGPPGSGKTTLACHLGRNPLLGSWYDVVLYAHSRHEAGWQAGDNAAILETLQEFIWTLDPDRRPAASLTGARTTLRNLLWNRRTLFILDDVADVQVLPQLFIAAAGNGLLAVVASGTALQDAVMHLQRVVIEGWHHEQAREYVSAVLERALSADQACVIDELNEWIDGLPVAWAALAELLYYEEEWPDLVEELKAMPGETARVRTVLERLCGRLQADQRQLLETLGAFAPHAAADPQAVAFVAGLVEKEVRDGLRDLHRRHVLHRFQGAGRFELHPVLHGFARDKLQQSGGLKDLTERHARFYADRIRPLCDEQSSPAWTAIVQRILPELPNVRLGQAWAAARAHPLVLDYFLNLAPYLVATRDEGTHAAWGQAALPAVEANPATIPALKRFAFYGQLPEPDPARRQANLERALAIAREEVEEHAAVYQVYALCRLAQFLHTEAGRPAEAEPLLREAQALAMESGYPDLETHVWADLARFFLALHDRAGLEAVVERLPADAPAMHAEGLSGAYYHGLRADVLRAVGRWEASCEAYDRIIALHDDIDDVVHGAEDRLRRAVCRARQGDHAGREKDLAWVRGRLSELPRASQSRYQLALSELALLAGDREGASVALDALPAEWQRDPDLAVDVWLARSHLDLAQGNSETRASDKARAAAGAQGFGHVRFEEDLQAERGLSVRRQ